MREEQQFEDPPLPPALRQALREWRALAESAARSGGVEEYEVVRRRGRLLATRVADALGRPVEFVDPATGRTESIDDRIDSFGAPEYSQVVVPWATGLPIAAFAAVVVTIGDIALSRAFADAFGLLWVPANLLVSVGLAPSLYLLRAVAFWRWPAIGTAVGLVVAWVVLLLGLLA
ncbi:MAG TPA: DUF2537 domain-containing protein [Pseudonocardia sp.]|nr:DUF2537 domain-containing protein [Pseudonocardia sp.]